MDVLVLLLQGGAVFVLFAGAMWFLKRHGSRSRGQHADHVAVMATTPLGRNASVHIVRIGEQTFALGVTDGGVSNLGAVTLPERDAPAATADTDASVASPASGGAVTLNGTFLERFTQAAKEQGAAPASLVAGFAYMARAVNKARKATPATQPGFADALLAASAATPVQATEPEPVTLLQPVIAPDATPARNQCMAYRGRPQADAELAGGAA